MSERKRQAHATSPALAERAFSDLHFIRSAMERSGRFTSVPGKAWVWMGLTAAVAAPLSANLSQTGWLYTWLGAAVIAAVLGFRGLLSKAQRDGVPLFSGPGRMFLLGLCPPLIAAGVLTGVFLSAGLYDLLAGLWLLLYGVGVTTGGAFSVPLVPMAGACFMFLGGFAFIAPVASHDALMAIGFGGVHCIFGFLVWRRHGG